MSHTCLVFGAGAIGKSVAGYVFNKAGFKIVFADISQSVVEDINKRRSYRIFLSEDKCDYVEVGNIEAVNANDRKKIISFICKVDYICTAVGGKGLDAVFRLISEGIRARVSCRNNNPLYILLCENHPDVYTYAMEKMKEILSISELDYVYPVAASIERMARGKISEDMYDVIAEEFYPIIFDRVKTPHIDLLSCNPGLFMPVDNLNAYYYRKLYTNNLGHAVLGYLGYHRGYKSIVESLEDIDIYHTLQDALHEAGSMLVKKFDFKENDMNTHIINLVSKRYCNRGLNDYISRVTRDPIRKLSRHERLIGSALLCMECGIYPEGIIKAIQYALKYNNPDDIQSMELNGIIKEKSMEYALETVCGLKKEDKLYYELLKLKKCLY